MVKQQRGDETRDKPKHISIHLPPPRSFPHGHGRDLSILATRAWSKSSRILVSLRVGKPAYFGLRFGFVVGGSLLTERFSRCAGLFCKFDAPDAAPSLANFRWYLAHLGDWVVNCAGIAEGRFSHQVFLSGSGTLLGMVGLFVSPRDSEQPTRAVAVHTRANMLAKRRRFTR